MRQSSVAILQNSHIIVMQSHKHTVANESVTLPVVPSVL